MNNAEKFRELIKSVGYSQRKAAEIITAETLKNISDRTVRAWLSKPDCMSSRPCPDWAILVLENHVKKVLALRHKVPIK